MAEASRVDIRATWRCWILVSILLLSILPLGCRKKAASIPVPKINPDALKFAAEGEAYLREGHLYSWRQAEAAFQKACDLDDSEEFSKRLLLARFLILTRQVDEDIPYRRSDEVVNELCSGGANLRPLCEIAGWYRRNKRDKPPDLDGMAIFNGEEPEIEAYFKALLPGAGTQKEMLLDQPNESPLSLYPYPWKLRTKNPAEIEKAYPHFAEAFENLAESLFQKKKYATAMTYFRKAFELIPDYTRAIIGLGNIYFFGLEDYEQALRWYESALEQDSTNTAAQFGKGAALHKLGRCEESNAVFDRMTVADQFKEGRLDEAGYKYYSGEGLYLMAYNYKQMKDAARAREWIELARQFLPQSEEINEFSGVLFYEEHKIEEARRDLLRALAKGNSSCNAQMYLGLVYYRMTDPEPPRQGLLDKGFRGYMETWSLREEGAEKKALNYFLGACSCMDNALKQLAIQIDSVPALDLGAQEKVLLTDRLKKRLLDYRLAWSADIGRMIGKVSQGAAAEKGTYVKLMEEILTRVRSTR